MKPWHQSFNSGTKNLCSLNACVQSPGLHMGHWHSNTLTIIANGCFSLLYLNLHQCFLWESSTKEITFNCSGHNGSQEMDYKQIPFLCTIQKMMGDLPLKQISVEPSKPTWWKGSNSTTVECWNDGLNFTYDHHRPHIVIINIVYEGVSRVWLKTNLLNTHLLYS